MSLIQTKIPIPEGDQSHSEGEGGGGSLWHCKLVSQVHLWGECIYLSLTFETGYSLLNALEMTGKLVEEELTFFTGYMQDYVGL